MSPKPTISTFSRNGGLFTRFPTNIERVSVRADKSQRAIYLAHEWNGDVREIALTAIDARAISNELLNAVDTLDHPEGVA